MFREAPRDLGYLEGVRKAVMEDVCFTGRCDLRDAVESAERRRIQDSIAVTLSIAAIVRRAVTVVAPSRSIRVHALLVLPPEAQLARPIEDEIPAPEQTK